MFIEGRGKDIRLHTNWEDPSPMSDREAGKYSDQNEYRISTEQALSEAGYGDTDLIRMLS